MDTWTILRFERTSVVWLALDIDRQDLCSWDLVEEEQWVGQLGEWLASAQLSLQTLQLDKVP